jgi:hypothetical protein
LRQASPEFCKAWKRHEVVQQGQGRKQIRHPDVGELLFEHAVFHPTDSPDQRLILYSPVPRSGTAEKLEQLIDSATELVAA